MSEKNVALVGAQTHTSCSLGEHPNILTTDSTCFSLSLTLALSAYWSWSKTLTLCTAICSDSFSASAHHLSEDICAFANGIPSLKLSISQLFSLY